jgi:hypothetical protein
VNYVLFIYAVVGISKYSSAEVIAQEWKPVAVFAGTPYNKQLCEEAAADLAMTKRYRCIPVGKGGML